MHEDLIGVHVTVLGRCVSRHSPLWLTALKWSGARDQVAPLRHDLVYHLYTRYSFLSFELQCAKFHGAFFEQVLPLQGVGRVLDCCTAVSKWS